MKKLTLTILAVLAAAIASTTARADVPDLIPLQGVLADDVGEPVDGAPLVM